MKNQPQKRGPVGESARTTRPAATGGSKARQGISIATPLTRSLGQREREIMSILCVRESASVQQVLERLSATLAYTTVMTLLDRLFKKGFLRRTKKDRAYIYSATLTSHEIEDRRAAALIHRFFADSGQPPDILLSCLVDAVHHYDTNLLDQLECKIRAARDQQAASKLTAEEGS